jgi:hypothetical protein
VFSLLFGHEKEEAEIKEYGTNKGMKKDEWVSEWMKHQRSKTERYEKRNYVKNV